MGGYPPISKRTHITNETINRLSIDFGRSFHHHELQPTSIEIYISEWFCLCYLAY
jgi:hypothetical protein